MSDKIPWWTPISRHELAQVESDDLRDAAVRHAQWAIGRSGRFWLYSGLIIAIGLPVIVLLVHEVPRWTRWLAPIQGPMIGGVLGGLLGGGATMLVASLFRHSTTRHFREYLRSHGIRVCMACGYNLAGSSGPVCPECGRPDSLISDAQASNPHGPSRGAT